MARYVLKFGGTSVANITRLEHVANIIKNEAENGHELVVVVSAMAGITNQLTDYARALCPDEITPEHDVILSSGEQVTCGLLALCLRRLGFYARSFLAWQIPILTDSAPAHARITHIPTNELESFMKAGGIPIVAGFQGINPEGRLTTLGRGGSDTTAVALASALGADRCDIYTDVDGVYTADPRLVPAAQKLPTITYTEMFEMAAQGAKVLQTRSVELAMKNNVNVRVLSSFMNSSGTKVVNERGIMENTPVCGVVHSENEVKITLTSMPDEVGIAATLFGTLAQYRINVDMLVQNYSLDGRTDLTFTLPRDDLDRSLIVFQDLKTKIGFSDIIADRDIVKISVIGVGMKSNLEIASTLFKTLAEKNINTQLISTSEIKISVVIGSEHTSLAMRALHSAFNLDEGDDIQS
ncbi:MAG: aspartate kinase [Alphaproteobacteria bacterium]|nr:aspartate kinase [Alphaproteobacteria bacterium]